MYMTLSPNIEIALFIYPIIMVPNCIRGERSLSKIKKAIADINEAAHKLLIKGTTF